jgi:hypothetical protein
MRLDANLHGAWKSLHEHDCGSEAHLKQLGTAAYPQANALRIKDDHQVIWLWDRAQGWYRPPWYQREERNEL